jgi:hypothetical protein
MPYSVVRIRGARDQSGNLGISWIRRTRIGGAWLNRIGRVPLAETCEAYEIEILDSKGTVVRTLESEDPCVTYFATNQIADGLEPPNPIAVRVFQISEFVGRGFPAGAVL